MLRMSAPINSADGDDERDYGSEEKEKAQAMSPSHMQTAAGDHPSPPPSYRSRIFSKPPDIAIAILWRTAVRIMVLATWLYCRLKHRLQETFS